jgi:hypothetical protein
MYQKQRMSMRIATAARSSCQSGKQCQEAQWQQQQEQQSPEQPDSQLTA